MKCRIVLKKNDVNVAVLLKKNSCTARTQKIYHLMSNSTETVADMDDLQESLADEAFSECIVSGWCCGFMRHTLPFHVSLVFA